MKTKLMPSIVLTAICLVVAGLLAIVNIFTAPVIKAAQDAAANEALLEVLPDGENFEELDISQLGLPTTVDKAFRASNGYVFQLTVTGYKPGLIIMCGINSDGKVSGAKYIQSNETLGAEDAIAGVFDGQDINTISTDLIAGPTARLTTMAYYNAIVDALNSFTILNGGEVDLRDPLEILQDSCNEALGTSGLTFSEGFVWSELSGVSAVYTSEAGRVYLIGETYVGVGNDGEVVTESATASESAIATTSDAIYASLSSVDFSTHDQISKRIVKAVYTTESGKYLFELAGAGYGINGPSYAQLSGEYIKIYLVIDSDGKIESCKTISQKESAGIGDVCATDEYTSEYEGLGSSDIIIIGSGESSSSDAPGVISGATFTTQGYQSAIAEAFEAYEILKGDGTDE